MDPIRALAIIWRASADPEGAALFITDDIENAEAMQRHGYGFKELRKAKPHQRSLPLMEGDEWITYFVLHPSGHERWIRILDTVMEPLTPLGGSERYVDGRLQGMS